MAVGKFHLPSGSNANNLVPTPYVRPVDWLPIDHLVSDGDQKIVILVAVFEDGNYVGVECSGNYTVNWGDGSVTNHTSGSAAYYQYDWNNIALNGTLTSRGYKQAILTITPQAGQNLTIARLNKKHSLAGLPNGYSHPWLDIKMSAPLMTELKIGQTTTSDPIPRLLEQFDWIGVNQMTNATSIFSQAIALKKVKNIYTNNVTNFTSFFNNCYELEHIPFLDTSNGILFSSFFSSCYKLKSVPNFDFSKGTTFNNAFQNCVSIIKFPDFNLIKATNLANMFNGCRSMLKSPSLILDNSLSKNFYGFFSSCSSMVEFTNINTGNGSNYFQMFYNCHSLKIIPDVIDTTTTSANFSLMFEGCYDLEKAPIMDLSKGIDFNSMFAYCYSITEFPAYNFSSAKVLSLAFYNCINLKRLPVMTIGASIEALNSCFNGCTSLEEAPNWNLQNTINVTDMFYNCPNLRKVPAYNLSSVTAASANFFANNLSLIECNVTGMKYTHSYANCKLSRTELVKIFNNLGTAAGTQTITITGNYGASSLTAGERAIATGKGWTIIG